MSYPMYRDLLVAMLDEVSRNEGDKIVLAAQWCVESISQGGVIHAFGSGHSHMLAEEMFFRAGGLVPVNPILDSDLMIHLDAPKSSRMERLTGLAEVLLAGESIEPQDIMFIFSNSGRNAVPVEMALAARAMGVKIIGVTSMAHSRAVTSRHPGHQKLYDVVDLVIDNHGVPGDAVVEVAGSSVKAASTSSVIGCFIVEAIVAETAAQMAQQGKTPPIIMSGNLDGATEYNARTRQEYMKRARNVRMRW